VLESVHVVVVDRSDQIVVVADKAQRSDELFVVGSGPFDGFSHQSGEVFLSGGDQGDHGSLEVSAGLLGDSAF